MAAYNNTIFCMARVQDEALYEESYRRRLFLIILVTSGISSTALPSSGKTKSKNPYDERRLLEQNKRIQRENSAPEEFPNFIREGLKYEYWFLFSTELLNFLFLLLGLFFGCRVFSESSDFRELCET